MANATGHERDDDDGDHDVGGGEIPCGVVEDLDERVAGLGQDDLGKIAHAETHGDGHDKTHGAVDVDGPHDGAGQGLGRVFDFFCCWIWRTMSASVSNEVGRER